MGRRALPKLDPTVDYSGHLCELGELPSPFDRQAWFPPADSRSSLTDRPATDLRSPPLARPLEIEIGSGKGLFLLNESGAHPETDWIGIEISKKYCRYAAYRLAQAGRTNARMLRGDGVDFVSRWIADQSVAALHVYFPDPWWKARHRRRRVVGEVLVEQAARVLVPGGRFHFWTDVEEYFDSGSEAILAGQKFSGPHPDGHTGAAVALESGDRYHTHFERRMLLNSHDVFRARFDRL